MGLWLINREVSSSHFLEDSRLDKEIYVNVKHPRDMYGQKNKVDSQFKPRLEKKKALL